MPVIDDDPTLSALLDAMHAESERQVFARARAQFQGTDEAFAQLARRYAGLAPERRGEFLEEHGLSSNDDAATADAALSLAISPAMGDFLYNVTLARGARSILELGSSNGVSTLYFAHALRALGRGSAIATELDSAKCARLRQNVAEAGLGTYVDVREGDVFATVASLSGTFDLVFLDIWGSLYLDAFRAVEHLLVPGTVVLADNMYTARREVAPFKAYLDASRPRISTTTMAFEAGVEFAVVRQD
jgi:predicted O-methyltransferase YrrM